MTKNQLWKGALAVLVATVPAFFTYLAARAESDEAKVRAQVAYETMAESVKDLQEVTYGQALQLAKLEGRMESCEKLRADLTVPVTGPRPPVPAPKPPSPVSDGDGIKSVQSKLRSPPSFSDAVQQFKAKK